MALKPVIVKLDSQATGSRRNGRDAVAAASRDHDVPSVSGLRQALIPPAVTQDGPRRAMTDSGRAGTDVSFHFDTGKEKKTVTMRLGTLTKRNTAAATAAVDAALGTDTPSLSRTASILHTLAANEDVPQDFAEEVELPPVAVAAPVAAARPRIQAARPLAAFRTAEGLQQMRQADASSATRSVSAPPVSVAPEVEVKIEIEGSGVFTAFYHQVIELVNVIVLVWDTRWRGTRFLPPEGENVPKMALQLVGSRRIFLVHPTAINIPFQHHELTVLLIEDTGEQPLDA